MELQPLVITRRKLVLRLVEVYFADEPEMPPLSGDLVVFLQARTGRGRCLPFHTLQLDLRNDPARLWSDFSKTTQYEIRRGEARDGPVVSIGLQPSAGEIDEFARFYDRFARGAGIARCNRGKLSSLNHSTALAISRADDGRGAALCRHAYIVTPSRARLLYSATSRSASSSSEESAAIARVHRTLHWADIQAFRRQGMFLYDFGGLALSGDPRLQGIDSFKRGFGGQVVVEYNCYVHQTLLGRLALAYLDSRRMPA